MLLKIKLSAKRPVVIKPDKIRYLRILVGENMNFKPYLQQLGRRVAKAINGLRRVFKKD